MVTLEVGGHSMTFMVDTGAEHSVVTTPVAPLRDRTITIVRAMGNCTSRLFCEACSCCLGGHLGTHEFLCLPGCPIPLLGKDLLMKLGAQITFAPGKPTSLTLGRQPALMMAVTVPPEDEWRLYA